MEDEKILNLEVPLGRLKGIKFEMLTRSDIKLFSTMVVSESSHVTDASLGLPNLSSCCLTCGASSVKDCEGHFGYVELPADICHPHFIPELVLILNKICPGCKSLRSRKKAKVSAAEKLMKSELTDGSIGCKYCSREYPSMKFKRIKRTLEIKAVVDADKIYGKDLNQQLPKDYWDFVPKYPQQLSSSFEMTLLPYQVFTLVKDMPSSLVERVCVKKDFLFLSRLPVTSNSSRVVEMMLMQLEGPTLMFDDRTTSYRRLVGINRHIDLLGPPVRLDEDLVPHYVGCRVKDCLNASKLFAKKSSSTRDGASESGLKWVKEVLLGKRTDNSFRMVVVGDPKIRLEEIGLPKRILNSLVVPEHVNALNLKKIIMYSKNSRLFRKKEEPGREILYVGRKQELKMGDIVYRPLEDGDLVLVNRPPTVHQHSTIALSVKALPNDNVASINPLCCAPFLGDFDGDCLGGFIPQSVRCKVELMELSSLDKQLINGQDGCGLLSLSHDSLTAAYFLTGNDVFLSKFEMQQLALLTPRQLVPPAIIKAPFAKTPLWTGKQVFSMLLPESFDFSFGASDVLIRKGDLLCVSPESTWLRKSEDNVFFSLLKENPAKFLEYLFAVQNVHCEWLTMRGFSVSLCDIHLSSDFSERKKCIDEVSLALQEVDNVIQTKALILDGNNEFLLTQSEWMGKPSHDYVSDHTSSLKPFCINEIDRAYGDIAHVLQNLISAYRSEGNAMVTMIKSGSKGSFGKLIQQSLCVGFQQALGFVRSKIPQKLSFHMSGHKSISELRQKQVDCGLVGSSFIDGLHPFEYFLHARSSRGTLYSDNADLPGTLSRKLMFYLRDIHVSYDGTVRSSYGNQLVQFSYGISSGDDAIADTTLNCTRTIGQPVGALAASAISEALYGALDQPSSLKVSPLKSLEKAMTGGSKSKIGYQPIVLYLSRQLSKFRYGYEYGALKVKSHLERVIFSDIVLTVTINRLFEPGVSDIDTSQWVTHFLVCKERMKRRGLTLNCVIDGLNREFNFGKKRKKFFVPNLYFNSGCSAHPCGVWHDHNELTMATEECGMTCFEIQNDLIPYLLETVVKGPPLVKKVEILYNDPYKPSKFRRHASDELCLMVHSVDNCNRTKFWGALQEESVSIMSFIDWERSHPIGVFSMYSAYGIGAASQYFLVDLDMAISEVRNVLTDHLFLTMNCLSLTGEFHGLNAKGIKQLRQQMSISSVFMEGCFSGPIHHFIRAAKEGVADDLLGSIDALAWGKEAPIGTGGPFSILFSSKELNLVEPGGEVFGILSTHKDDVNFKKRKVDDVCLKKKTSSQAKSGFKKIMWKNYSKKVDSADNVWSHLEDRKRNMSPQQLASLQRIEALEKNIKNMLSRYPIDGYLNEADKCTILNVLHYHPQEREKVGCGVQAVKVALHPLHPTSRCFMAVRSDGTVEDFSYRKCLDGALTKLVYTEGSNSYTNGLG